MQVPVLNSPTQVSRRAVPEHLDVIWLPLPYHPLLYNALRAAVAEVNNDDLVNSIFRAGFNGRRKRPLIRIAWKNALPAQWKRIRSSNSLILKGALKHGLVGGWEDGG